MDKHQREYYLNEQIKAIQKELGRKDEKAELDDLKKKIEDAGMSEEAKEKALQEFARLEGMPPMSAESTVSRTYLDWLINVPWKNRSEEIDDLHQAEKTLNEDHYGLKRSRNASWSFWQSGSSFKIRKVRYFALSELQGSVRPHWVNRSRTPRAASLFVSRLAAFTMKLRYADIGARTSEHCPDRSFS